MSNIQKHQINFSCMWAFSYSLLMMTRFFAKKAIVFCQARRAQKPFTAWGTAILHDLVFLKNTWNAENRNHNGPPGAAADERWIAQQANLYRFFAQPTSYRTVESSSLNVARSLLPHYAQAHNVIGSPKCQCSKWVGIGAAWLDRRDLEGR